jgi:hypothetical protein
VKFIFRDKILLVLLAITLVIKIFSANEEWVEKYYTYGVYPTIARGLRILFGWIPISIGDLLYASAAIYLIIKVFRFIQHLRNKTLTKEKWIKLARSFFKIALVIYLVFNILWGLNYDRKGIAKQINLDVQQYSLQDLDTLTTVLLHRVNVYAEKIDTNNREKLANPNQLFMESTKAYNRAADKWPFLKYTNPSIKASLFTRIGHFIGFTGYYNPFTGEAQVKTTVPEFLKPFIVTHEIAHQLGYAKENEANLVAYLASANCENLDFKYSIYFGLYYYSIREVAKRDTVMAAAYKQKLHPQVVKDREEVLKYIERTANSIEPIMTRFYDQYLKLNRQPEGKRTYNEVITWLIAYMKRYGREAL